MVEQDASDLFLKVGTRPHIRLHGTVCPVGDEALSQEEILEVTDRLLSPQQRQQFHDARELNFAFDCTDVGRFRANVLWQRGVVALVIRRIRRGMPSFHALSLPEAVLERWLAEPHGLVLVTGPTGSGKSTTVAAMLEYLNQHTTKHIVTLEDPIEFQFGEGRAIINQREVGVDTRSFSEGLQNVFRQSPDVLFVSDIRAQETMEAALLAAEAGQFVLSCLHSTNAVTTIERIVAFFPSSQHRLIRLRLSLTLRGILSLRLLRRRDGAGRIPVCEVMVVTSAIRELIREGRTAELPPKIHDGGGEGMQTITQALDQRYRQGEVTLEEAQRYADSADELQLAVQGIRATRDIAS